MIRRKPPPADPATMTPSVLTVMAGAMARVLEREQELCDFGFDVPDQLKKPKAEHAVELARDRNNLYMPSSLAAFAAARDWLRQFNKIKKLNRYGTSYGLKHVAEYDIGYVTNGVFIAAAFTEGFRVKRLRGSPNALLNITMAAWQKHDDQRW